MACATNSSKVTQTAGKNGITPASSRAGYALGAGRRKQIYIRTDMPFSEAAPLTILARGKQIPGYGVDIAGPSVVVSVVGENGRPIVWIETRSPLDVLPKPEFDQGQKPARNNRQGSVTTGTPEKVTRPQKEGQEQPPVSRATISGNARQFWQAIKQQRKVQVQYRSSRGRQRYTLIPLDIKPGRTANTKKRRYMWGYSESGQSVLCLRLDKVIGMEPSDETFDPGTVAKAWDGKQVKWNLPREW